MTGILHEDQYTLLIISRSVLLRMRNISVRFAEKIKTHILCSVTFIFFENLGVCGGNVESYCAAGHATDGNMAYAHFTPDN